MRPMDQQARQLRRRLRAARELAGFERMEDLVDAIGEERGYALSTLYAIEQGQPPAPGPAKLARIADACGLDPAWFYVDIHKAIRTAGGGLSVAELARRAATSASEEPPGAFGQHASDSPSNPEDRREDDSDQEEGRPPDAGSG